MFFATSTRAHTVGPAGKTPNSSASGILNIFRVERLIMDTRRRTEPRREARNLTLGGKEQNRL